MNDLYKILIIDDEEIVLDSCTEILSNADYEIATAGNGIIGLELVEEFEPDIVFVDLKMPGISGLEVLERIHTSDPSIITIVITGFATVDSAVDAMKLNAYDFLPKPFTPDELRLITKRGLENRKLILETIKLRREKEMLRENFAAIVSHELKSPLGAVQQNLMNIVFELSDVISEDQKNRLERMKIRIAELMELVNTWLRVFSTDIEAIKDQFKPISIDTIIAKSVETIEPHAVRKDIELNVLIDEPLHQILGEEVTLSEALINIGNNAVKYSHAGGEITFHAQERDNFLEVSISDTGIGISDDDLPYIFDDFYSGKTGKSNHRGVGVGLAISKRIIETHGGTISVESKLGEGSKFVLSLPLYNND